MVVRRSVTILNRRGLHARAAAKFVATASRYPCSIQVTRDQRVVNGKSIMGLLLLAAGEGSRLDLSLEGEAAEAATEALVQLIADRFGEGV